MRRNQKKLITILMLMFVFPLGVSLVRENEDWDTRTKIFIISMYMICVIMGMFIAGKIVTDQLAKIN